MIKRTTRIAQCLAAMCLAIAMTGCAMLGQSDPASGHWEGSWYGPDPEKPLGDLKADIVATENGEWIATFDASFGGQASYKVDLPGRREGDKVVFGGVEELGEASGGAFQWTGEADGEVFSGNYTSQMINGSFKMMRVSTEVE